MLYHEIVRVRKAPRNDVAEADIKPTYGRGRHTSGGSRRKPTKEELLFNEHGSFHIRKGISVEPKTISD
jgi:hypothetical protein